jgi:DNA-binding NtrC family response regulator
VSRGTLRAWMRDMGLTDVWPLTNGRTPDARPVPADVAVLEDDPSLAQLAVELCDRQGLSAATYASPASFLGEVSHTPPRLLILDWRFERELGSAVFMSVRHRFGDVPIVCWTATPISDLPSMLIRDPRVRIVQKDRGVDAFDAALRWAANQPADGLPNDGGSRP